MFFLSIVKCFCVQMRPFNEVCQQLILFMCTDFILFLNFLFYVEVQVIHNVGSVSGVQQSDSVTHIHESVLVAQLCLTLCDSVNSSHQAPLSMGFSRQEYWNRQPFLSGPRASSQPRSLVLQADSLPSKPSGKHIHIACICSFSNSFPIQIVT